MTPDPIALASLAAGLGAALVSGVFLAFSDFVMRGLAAAGTGNAAPAMQGINRTVLRSVFLALLLGLGPAGLALTGAAALAGGPGTGWLAAASALHLGAVLGVTVAGNVPMNNRLDAEGAAYWPGYLRRWTRLNHLRTLGALAAAACFLAAAMARA